MAQLAEKMQQFCEEQLVNCIGSYCGGTHPQEIVALKSMTEQFETRRRHDVEPVMRLSGLVALTNKSGADDDCSTFMHVAPSVYSKALEANDHDKAASIALKQVSITTSLQPGLPDPKLHSSSCASMIKCVCMF